MTEPKAPCTLCWTLRFFFLGLALIIGLAVGKKTFDLPTGDQSTLELQMGTYLPDNFKPIVDATLINDEAIVGSTKMLNGHWRLIYVGYTSCPDFCPSAVGVMKNMLKNMTTNERDEFRGTLLSIDPQRDTPAVLKGYMDYFDPELEGFSSDKENLDKIVFAMGGVYAKRDLGNGEYAMDHSDTFFLIDPDGDIRAVLSDTSDADKLLEDYRLIRSKN